MSWSIEEDLEAAQDSFEHLFCQRFLIFDCKLHGCSQVLIFSVPNLDGNAGTSPIQLDIEQKTALSSDACD
ncbi:hypothetical protein Tco_1356055 [Tanacetum coccineum]